MIPRSVERVTLQRVPDERGAMYIGTRGREMAFHPSRFFFIENTRPVPVARGGHAHIWQEQLLVPVVGSAFVEADHGPPPARRIFTATLVVGDALHIPPGVWVDVELAPGTRLLVLASGPYDEAEYIRTRADYTRMLAA